MPARGSIEEFDAVPRDNSDDPHFLRGEAARARIQFLRVPRADDPIIHHDQRAFAARVVSCRHPDSRQQIDGTIRADAGGRPLGADNDDGLI